MSNSRTAGVSALATMWQRIPGHVAADIAHRIPLNYALLELPPNQLLKPLGVGDDKEVWGRTRDHPYSKWSTKSFVKDTTLKEALVIVEKENAALPRLAKARIQFFDGVQLTLERKNVNDPSSLVCVSCYDPSGKYHETTSLRASESRNSLTKQLKPLSDNNGRITATGSNKPPSSFAPEVLYRDCPPPDHNQPGFDFEPVSHNSFLVRPNVKLPGVRPGVCDTAPAAIHFRPRAFLRAQSVEHKHTKNPEVFQVGTRTLDLALQAEVINQRNILSTSKLPVSPLGTIRSHSSLRPLADEASVPRSEAVATATK